MIIIFKLQNVIMVNRLNRNVVMIMFVYYRLVSVLYDRFGYYPALPVLTNKNTFVRYNIGVLPISRVLVLNINLSNFVFYGRKGCVGCKEITRAMRLSICQTARRVHK